MQVSSVIHFFQMDTCSCSSLSVCPGGKGLFCLLLQWIVGVGSGTECLGHPHILPFAFTRSQCINQMKEVKEQCEERIEEVIRQRNEALVSRDVADDQHQQVI